jgi:quercetin dioxygenase-like cupin family protein
VSAATLEAQVVTTAEPLWFLGTLVRPKLTGAQTGGRLALWEGLLPKGAAPPLHTHPQDETFYLLEGSATVWVGRPDGEPYERWLETHARPCEAGAAIFVPGGIPHTFRVLSDTARMLFLSTPAGIEQFVHELSEPAAWPWLQPPPEAPRVSPERMEAAELEHGVIRVGPPPGARASSISTR